MSGGRSGVSQVELAAAIGSYVGPLIGALAGAYLSYVLGRSRDKPQEAPHAESDLSVGTALELARLPRDVPKELDLMKANIADLEKSVRTLQRLQCQSSSEDCLSTQQQQEQIKPADSEGVGPRT